MLELFEGVSLAAFAAGNRRIIKAVKARTTKPAEPTPDPCEHPDHKKNPDHAEHCASHPKPVEPPADEPNRFKVWAPRAGWTAGGLFLFGRVLWSAVAPYIPVTLATAVVLWVLVALVMGQQQDAEPVVEHQADDSTESAAPAPVATVQAPADTVAAVTLTKADHTAPAPTEADRARFAEALLRTVEYTVSTAKAQGRPGVHLSTLAEVVRRAGATGPVNDDRMAALLASLRVPVTGLTLGPKTARINRRGVRFDQLSEALGRAPRQDPATAAATAADRTPAESIA